MFQWFSGWLRSDSTLHGRRWWRFALLGLTLPGREPAAFLPKLAAIRDALPTVTPAAVAIAGAAAANNMVATKAARAFLKRFMTFSFPFW